MPHGLRGLRSGLSHLQTPAFLHRPSEANKGAPGIALNLLSVLVSQDALGLWPT